MLIISILYAIQFNPNDISRVAHFLPLATSTFIVFLGLEAKNKIFSKKFYKWGGNISYPLYLCHILIISVIGRFLIYLNIQFNYIVIGCLIFMSFASAHIIWILYDKPIQRYLKRLVN